MLNKLYKLQKDGVGIMMIDKRLLNLCKESKKYIGLTVLMNWISVICNLMTIIVIGFSIQELFSLGNIENLNKKY